jgi:hypothetical protein
LGALLDMHLPSTDAGDFSSHDAPNAAVARTASGAKISAARLSADMVPASPS